MSLKVTNKKKTSPLWAFFSRIDDHFAKCESCKQKISYKTSTTNLKKHLKNKHPTLKIPALGSARIYRFSSKIPEEINKVEPTPLWEFFTPVDGFFAHCNVCNQKFSYRTSTSNLKKHFKNKHPTVIIPASTSIRTHKRSSKTPPPKLISRAKTSPLWAFFTPVDAHFANCNMCKQEFSYKTSTTNLKKHLKNKHPTVDIYGSPSTGPYEYSIQTQATDTEPESEHDEPQPFTRSCQSLTSSNQSQTPRVNKTERQLLVQTCDTRKNYGTSNDQNDRKLLNLFIQDFQPLSMLQDSGFQGFITALNPTYQLPSKHVVSKTLLPDIYEKCHTKTKALIDTGKTFCITTDSWTSTNKVSYNSITAHFLDSNFKLISLLLECFATDTRKNLHSELQRIATEWGIKNKIIVVVLDNVSNIVCEVEDAGSWKHVGCVAHMIDLTVKDGLNNENIQTIINKVKEIARHFRKNNVAHDKLMEYQENHGRTLPLKLILEVSTTWCSTFYMLQRFIELEEAVKSTIANKEQELPTLTAGEWKTIKELCQVLRPFEDATEAISGEKYCTASLVIPICNGIKKTLLKLSKKQFSEPIETVLEVLQSNFEERFGSIENSDILSVSSFLDPKFKQMAFSNNTTASSVKQKIINMIATKVNIKYQEQEAEPKTGNVSDGGDEEEMSIWSDFDRSVAANQAEGTTSHAVTEMQLYMEQEIIPRHSDSLLWWHQHKQMLPHLSEVAQDRLCALASPRPCERLFPEAGQLLTKQRNRLEDNVVQKLMFLNANHMYLS